MDGLGYYNGGAAAGASQPRKHLQFFPLKQLYATYPVAHSQHQVSCCSAAMMGLKSWAQFGIVCKIQLDTMYVWTLLCLCVCVLCQSLPISSAVDRASKGLSYDDIFTLPHFAFKHAFMSVKTVSQSNFERAGSGESLLSSFYWSHCSDVVWHVERVTLSNWRQHQN